MNITAVSGVKDTNGMTWLRMGMRWELPRHSGQESLSKQETFIISHGTGSWSVSRYYFTNSRCLVIESWSLLLQKALPQEMTNQQHLPKECLLSKLFCNSTLILEDDQESWRGKGNSDRIKDTSLGAGVGVGDQLVLRPHLFLLLPLWWLYLEPLGIWASTSADVGLIHCDGKGATSPFSVCEREGPYPAYCLAFLWRSKPDHVSFGVAQTRYSS